jgi:protein gp37
MSLSKIQWTDVTWNPTRGCSRVSEGCRHCYAERQAYRVNAMQRAQGNPEPYAGLVEKVGNEPRWTGEVELVREKLLEPLGWRLHRKVFVNSMSDLFHESLSNEEIAAVFGAMVLAHVQTFQVLTKRAARLPMWNEWIRAEADALLDSVPGRPRSGSAVATACVLYLMNVVDPTGAGIKKESAWLNAAAGVPWPAPNVWLGVSVEDQWTADERIPHLLQTPAAVRFVSAEPLLGPVDLGLQSATCSCCARWASRWVRLKRRVSSDVYLGYRPDMTVAGGTLTRAESNPHGALSVRTPGGLLGIKPAEFDCLPALDWVIVGGESGPRARACDVAWVRSIVEQCHKASVAAFVKQLGAYAIVDPRYDRDRPSGATRRLADAKGGDPAEWPLDIRVREFPGARA